MSVALAFPLVDWGRPAALLLFAVPLVLLVFARARPLASEIATGAIDLWARIATASPTRRARERRRIPPAAAWLAGALALGVLALADPVFAREHATFVVLVDRSPSMYLSDGDAIRLDRAWSRAARELGGLRVIGPFELDDGVERIATATFDLPSAWRAPPPREREAPSFADHDRPRVLWITDRAPEVPARGAGMSASGGRAMPGPIASDGAVRIDWDGVQLVQVAGSAPARSVRVSGALAAPIDAIVGAWSAARGIGRASDGGFAELEVRATSGGDVASASASRDGWRAGGTARHAPVESEDGPCAVWLADATDERALVTWCRGLVHTAWAAMDEPRGDPAAFAVSWARLFDAALAPGAGIVELSERADAGAARWHAPELAGERAARMRDATAAWLACAALVAALVALWKTTTMAREIAA